MIALPFWPFNARPLPTAPRITLRDDLAARSADMQAALTDARVALFDAAAKLPAEERLTWAKATVAKWITEDPKAAREFGWGVLAQVDEELDRRAATAAAATRNGGA